MSTSRLNAVRPIAGRRKLPPSVQADENLPHREAAGKVALLVTGLVDFAGESGWDGGKEEGCEGEELHCDLLGSVELLVGVWFVDWMFLG